MSEPVLKLGEHYVSDFLNADESSTDRKKYSLDLYMDEAIGAVRLKSESLPPNEAMWGRYWYRSGTNATMNKELHGIVNEVLDRVKLEPEEVWLDIACNDGTLLSHIPNHVKKIGIDPCDDSYLKESSKHGTIVQNYFTKDNYDSAFAGAAVTKAKVITCIAMFYDLDDPHPFIKDLYEVLHDDGIIVLQMSYTPLMLQQMAFDNICHEHVYYHSLNSIAELFTQHGFQIVDANVNDTNGGSIRIYIAKQKADPKSFGTPQLRQVCAYRTDSIMNFERIADISDPYAWNLFGEKLQALRISIIDFVKTARAEGKTIYGYGASTKGNTLLQYFGLTKEDIVAIAERSPYKWGKKTVGTEIPICSENEMREAKPDYLLVLPWHFIDEFVKRETDYLKAGGALVVPCPEFKVITAADL